MDKIIRFFLAVAVLVSCAPTAERVPNATGEVSLDLAAVYITSDNGNDFGSVLVGSSKAVLFRLSNESGRRNENLEFGEFPAGFGFTGGAFPGLQGNCQSTLEGKSTCNVEIEFRPLAAGVSVTSVVISFDQGKRHKTVTLFLTGKGESPIPASPTPTPTVVPSPTPSPTPLTGVQVLMANPVQLSVAPGGAFSLQYNWQAGPTSIAYRVFVHFVNAAGVNSLGGGDHIPPTPTTEWSGPISYSRSYTLPATAAVGSYKIMIGLYDPATGQRLSLAAGPGVLADATSRYQIGTLTVGVNATPPPTPTPTPSPSPSPSPTPGPTIPMRSYSVDIAPMMQALTCTSCHSTATKYAGLSLDTYRQADYANGDLFTRWNNAYLRMKNLSMPPGNPKASAAQLQIMMEWIAQGMPEFPGNPMSTPSPTPVACTSTPDPGRVGLHRLSHLEYNNTVRDLFATMLRPADNFLEDGGFFGFDNIANVLTINSTTLADYYDAAGAVAQEAAMKSFGATPGPIPSCASGNLTLSCAQQIIVALLPKIYRRPVTVTEVNRITDLFIIATGQGDGFNAAMAVAIQGALVSADFLYRVELDTNPNDPYSVKALTPWELASRLSYFLWSSMPDAALFQVAQDGSLTSDATLRAQVGRMLLDSKSETLVSNFGERWLGVRKLDNVNPDPTVFPTYSATLRDSMKNETRNFFRNIKTQNLSLMDILIANYTFVNGQLASLYGIPNVSGTTFQKVSFPIGSQRKGLLTQGTYLMGNAKPTGTHPIRRGHFVLDNLLCSPPPPPPANVVPTTPVDPTAPKKVQLEQHRSAGSSCFACHAMMDPIGLGFENFDGLGAYRSVENGVTIDPSGTLVGNLNFNNHLELIGLLQAAPDFSNCVAQKFVTYGVGRTPMNGDACAIESILQQSKPGNYLFNDLVTNIVLSPIFRQRRGEGTR